MQRDDENVECAVCSQSRNRDEVTRCSNCRPVHAPVYFCSHHCSEPSCAHALGCTVSGHQTCWEAHRPSAMRGLHHKIDPFTDQYIEWVTRSERDPERQRDRHAQDRAAKWFIIAKNSNSTSQSAVYVSNRFRHICEIASSPMVRHTPSFVSFIGDTGVGKSTLIRAMILMGQIEERNFADRRSNEDGAFRTPSRNEVASLRRLLDTNSPVTRLDDPTNLDPTTSGVHLYRDPKVTGESKDVPLLLVDCEGFRAGTAITNAERSAGLVPESYTSRTTTAAGTSSRRSPSPLREPPALSDQFLHEIPITSEKFMGRGKKGAEELCAQFLYAFSDVIVFVTKADQSLHDDMRRVLEWAALAVDSYMNQKPQRTLIVVTNMPTHRTKEPGGESLLTQILEDKEKLWDQSETLKKFKQQYDLRHNLDENKMHSNTQLFDALFQRGLICSVSHKANVQPDQMFNEYRHLRTIIEAAVRRGQEARKHSWTRYSVATFTHLLNKGFWHFAQKNTPFDFYTAARKDNPNPTSMQEHIANLIRLMQNNDLPQTEISVIVSACLVSYIQRQFEHKFDPQLVFNNTLRKICKEGIEYYSNEHQRCNFRFRNGSQCWGFPRTHHNEHTNSVSGNKATGIFDSTGYAVDSDARIAEMDSRFSDAVKTLFSDKDGNKKSPDNSEVSRFRGKYLSSESIKKLGFWDKLKSNKTCLACLQFAPDHVLPCGHSICLSCAKDFGEESHTYECAISLKKCILCVKHFGDNPQHIRFKPRCAGVRLLTLDGGGVRGIVELAILKKLRARVGLDLPIRELFDLVVGTSTGGIVSLGIALTDDKIEDLSEKFMSLARRTFEVGRDGPFKHVDWKHLTVNLLIFLGVISSRYRTTPLKEALKDLFGANQSLFSSSPTSQRQRATRVCVVSSYDGRHLVISNYSRAFRAKLRFQNEAQVGDTSRSEGLSTEEQDFEREDEPDQEIKAWEAGLATSAAPYYFKPFKKDFTSKDSKLFVDGGLHYNFPLELALQEKERIWPSSEQYKVKLDTALSIGTGIQKKEIELPVMIGGGFAEICKTFFNNIDTERAWERFQNDWAQSPDLPRIRRLNVPLGPSYVSLDNYNELNRMQDAVDTAATRHGMRFRRELDEAAHSLIGALLFFEPDPVEPSQEVVQLKQGVRYLPGTIRCRLAYSGDGVANLVYLIKGIYHTQSIQAQTVASNATSSGWEELAMLSDDFRREVGDRGARLRIPVTIKTKNVDTVHTIAVRLKDRYGDDGLRTGSPAPSTLTDYVPISGFPVKFKELEQLAKQS